MSTPARYAQAIVQPDSAIPAASTALVAVVGDGRQTQVPVERPVNAHRMFYLMGYLGLALIWTSMWLEAFIGTRSEATAAIGMMFTGLGGFGVFIHTVYRPNERKVRHLLLAIGSLALTILSYPLVEDVSREMYATEAVGRLQPLAETLAKDARVREIGVTYNGVVFNEFTGAEDGGGTTTLAGVLARDGISREEYRAYQQELRRAGMDRAQRTPSTVAFNPDGPYGLWLLYVIPGHALPPAHALVDANETYYSQPLGGPWYMVLSDSR